MVRTVESSRRYLLMAVGLIALAYVMIALLAPQDIADYTAIDTSYWRETDHRLLLKTSYEYNNISEIEGFPESLGNWKGYDFSYSERVYEVLEADILLSRAYTKDRTLIWMDIINSKSGKSFHDPTICYGGKFNILNESVEEMHVTGNKSYLTFSRMHVNKLELENKENPGGKQVVLYWFMFKRFNDEHGVTMIRLSAPVRTDVNETYDFMKTFVEEELFSAMYESEVTEKTVAEGLIDRHGRLGILLIFILTGLPVILIFFGQFERLFKLVRRR
ncbi:MAG: exosortase-associated EpsI family protein [Halobacteriota archaeon]|nr:exosortase-associated EpsI family protein [Halobacteriota archaeon]